MKSFLIEYKWKIFIAIFIVLAWQYWQAKKNGHVKLAQNVEESVADQVN